MCGKFTQLASWQDVHAFSQPLTISETEEVIVTPMRFANIMLLNGDGKRELVSLRWGFAGRDDPTPTRPKHMHGRSETIDTLPTFRHAFAHARAILVVHTFNEGEELPNGKTKQRVVTPNDGHPIAIAVICEEWHNGSETLETFVQVTVPANMLISRITDRMPAILPREAWPTWLGETDAPLNQVKSLLRTFEDGGTWTMTEQASSKPRRPAKPPRFDPQMSLF